MKPPKVSVPGTASRDDVGELVGYLLAIADLHARRLFQQHVGSRYELRPVEFSALLLCRSGITSPKKLAAALRLEAPQVTILVDRLAARGLVQRQRSSTDGRAVLVVLTDSGSELARQAHCSALAMEELMLKPLSSAERAMLRELLSKVARPTAA